VCPIYDLIKSNQIKSNQIKSNQIKRTLRCARNSFEYSSGFLTTSTTFEVWALLLLLLLLSELFLEPKIKPELGADTAEEGVEDPNLNPELVITPPNAGLTGSATLGLDPGLGSAQHAQASLSGSFCIIHIL
jgi:hypothetical protein